METKKILSALCYFSMLFAGFIFPLVVFIVTEDTETKTHAKKALLSHLIPLIPLPVLAYSLYHDITKGNDQFPVYTTTCVICMVLISIMVLIWNIVKGVMVLKDN